MDEEIIFKPIGYIKSPYEDVKNMPKSTRESGDVEAEMIINEWFSFISISQKDLSKGFHLWETVRLRDCFQLMLHIGQILLGSLQLR